MAKPADNKDTESQATQGHAKPRSRHRRKPAAASESPQPANHQAKSRHPAAGAASSQAHAHALHSTSGSNSNSSNNKARATNKLLKYLDDYRSASDIKALRLEGYEIDYDKLVGVGHNSAVFLAHPLAVPAPAPDPTSKQLPLYVPGYHIASKVVVKRHLRDGRPSKTRTGNLKLALALGQTRDDHNILRVIDVFKTPARIFIFMNYCSYGNLINFMRRNGTVPGRLAKKWSQQVAAALDFLHRFHVAHRNYKLENVLVDEHLDAKLTGFGLSKFCVDLKSKQPVLSRTICGSEPYLAPEMLRPAHERLYNPTRADVWAFGVGLFLSFTRRYPFPAQTLKALRAEQLEAKYLERDTHQRLEAPVRELLAAIFQIEPRLRPSMHELLQSSSWLLPPSPNADCQERSSTAAAAASSERGPSSPAADDDRLHQELSPVVPLAHPPQNALPPAPLGGHLSKTK